MSRVVGAKGWRWWRTSQILTPSTDADSWQRSESTSTGEVRLNFCRCANKTLKTNQVAICSVRRARSSRPLRHYDDWRVFRLWSLTSLQSFTLHASPLQVSLPTSNEGSFQTPIPAEQPGSRPKSKYPRPETSWGLHCVVTPELLISIWAHITVKPSSVSEIPTLRWEKHIKHIIPIDVKTHFCSACSDGCLWHKKLQTLKRRS